MKPKPLDLGIKQDNLTEKEKRDFLSFDDKLRRLPEEKTGWDYYDELEIIHYKCGCITKRTKTLYSKIDEVIHSCQEHKEDWS